MKETFSQVLGCAYDRDTDLSHMSQFHDESGSMTRRAKTCRPVSQRQFDITIQGRHTAIGDGNVVIAAITSCTNTSNPFMS